ncbi:MAG: ATP synthase F1 subunit epsilon [Candidatus Shapirobacteria bacterium]
MNLTVLSPTTKHIYEDVKGVVIESEAGIIEVLPEHQKLISALSIGVARVKMGDKTEILVINGGVLKVEKDELEIITSNAVPPRDIIEKDIEKALLLAQNKITPTTLPTELIRIEKEIKYQKLKQRTREQLGNG